MYFSSSGSGTLFKLSATLAFTLNLFSFIARPMVGERKPCNREKSSLRRIEKKRQIANSKIEEVSKDENRMDKGRGLYSFCFIYHIFCMRMVYFSRDVT